MHMKRPVSRAAGLALLLLVVAAAWAGPFDRTPTPADTIRRVRALLGARKTREAIDLLKKEQAKDPNNSRVHYYLGLAYKQDGKLDLAEAEFTTVLQLDKAYIEAHYELADLAIRKVSSTQSKPKNLELLQKAIGHLNTALEHNPLDTRLYYRLAALHVDTARFRDTDPEVGFTKALDILKEVKKRKPNDVQPHFAMGNTRFAHANLIAGGKPFAELEGDIKTRCTQLLDQAVADFKKALEVDPQFLAALNRIAAIRNARGHLKEAIQTLQNHVDKLDTAARKARCYRWMGQYLVQGGQLSEAEGKFAKAIEIEPRELPSYLLLADVLQRRKLPEQAAETLVKAVRVDPNFLNAHVQLGLLALRKPNVTEAAQHFRSALNVPPAKAFVVSPSNRPVQLVRDDLYATAAVRLGDIHVSKEQYQEAIIVFRTLGTLIPQSPLPEFQIGEVYRRWDGHDKQAREHYQAALRRDKNYVRAMFALADMDVEDARFAADNERKARLYKRAIDQYELALETMPEQSANQGSRAAVYDRLAQLRVLRANCFSPRNRAVMELAQANAEKATELAPNQLGFRARLSAIHDELGQTKKSVAELNKLIDKVQKVIDRQPDNVQAIYQLADLRFTLHSRKGDKTAFQQGIKGCELAIKKQPDFLPPYVRVARALEEEKEYVESAKWYERLFKAAKKEDRVTALPPERSRHALHAAAELAWIYCEYLGQLDKALRWAEIASDLDANLPSLLDTIGWIYHKKGEYPRAIPYLRRAYKGAPTNATVGYHLGAALLANKNADGAKEVLRQARKHAGDDKELQAKIEKLLRTIGG
jgi:tetratricopeptide (TPR) repeat protein